MEETAEDLQKKSFKFIKDLQESVGPSHFYGVLWMSILRVNKIRNAGLKFLTKILKQKQKIQQSMSIDTSKQDDDDEQAPESMGQHLDSQSSGSGNQSNNNQENQQQQSLEDINKNNRTNSNSVNESAVFSSINLNHFQNSQHDQIQQQLQQNIKQIFDIDNEDPSVKYPNKQGLLLNALLISLEDSNQQVKRNVLDLMNISFPIANQEGTTSLLSDNEITLLVQGCLKLYAKKEHATQRRIDKWFFGATDEERSQKDYTPEIQKHIIKAVVTIIDDTTENCINQKLEQHLDGNQENKIEVQLIAPLKILLNLFMVHDLLVPQIIGNLAYPLMNFIKNFYQYKEVQKAAERVYESIGSYSQVIILNIIDQFYQDFKNQKLCLKSIELIQFCFQFMIFNNEDIERESQIDCLKPTIQQLTNFLGQLDNQQFFTFKYTQMALLQIYDLIQKLLYNIPESEYNYKAEDDQFIEKFITNYQKITEYILNVESEEIPNLRVDSFSIATKIVNVLVKYKILSSKYVYDQFPEFMIEQLKCLDSDMPSLQLITLESLVDIIVSSQAKEEFKQLRNYLEKDDYKIIYKIFRHLWSFLDFHFQEKKIIDFIIIIMQEYPDIYESVINQEFEEHPDTCVLRYSTFFSQTNDFYKRNSKQNEGIGLIPMLTLLEDQNPLIRQSCRSWLTDASSNLFRILDHMIDILIEAHEEAEIKFLESHFYVYTKNYNSKKVIIAMNLLQIVMENLKDIFIQYLFTIKISHKIIERIQEGPYKSKIDLHNCSYLNILMFLLIQFIQGQAQDEQSQEFISQNAIISAKCCEYLEQMLDIAQSIEVSQEILKNSFANILSILRNFINRKDQVMQVQILNLLRTIIIKIKETLAFNKIKKNEYSEQYLALKQQIGSKLFFENLINGLIQAEDHYVKARYINIITIGVHMLSEFLEEQILTENLKLILTKYFDIVKGINLSEEQGDQEEEDQYVYSELRYTRNQLSVGVNVKVDNIFKNKDISSLRSKESMTTQLYSKKQQLKQTLYAHGKIKANQYSQENFQEVINIFDSLKAILNYFLKFRENEKNSYISVKENSIVLDIKTQGLLSQDSRTYKDYEPNKSTLRKYSNAVSLILSSLPQILLTYLSVWNLSPNFEKHRLFTDKGIFSYNFDDFKVFNQLLQEDILKLKSQGESDVVKRHVLEVLSPLSQKFSMHFVNAILQTWMIQCTKEFFDEAQYNVTMIKLMEVLITLDITPDAIFTALLSTPVVQSIQQFYTRKYQLKKQTHLYIFDFAQQENNILFFLYTYLSYTSLTVIQKSKLKMIWQEGLKLLQIFRLSMVPQTTFWTQEILLLLSRKFSPSEILEDKSLKKEIHRFCKSQLNLLAIISAQRCSFVTNIDPKNQDLAKQKFKLLTPFTPTIYKCYQNYSNFLKDDEGAENKHDYNIEKIIFSPSGSQQSEDVLNHEEYQIRMSLMSLKTLQNISLHLLQNIYDTNSRVTQIVKDFLVAIMPLIDDRNPQNKYLTESACEFLHSLLTISRDTLINDLKKSVSDIFMKNEFFKCTKLTLRYWTDIINMTIEKGDILADLLQNNNVFTKLFTFSSSEYQKKIKNFERICFIIYSGKKDQYKSQLKILIDSMSVVINDPDAAYEQTALIILILFCIRILILRLSQEVQQDLFRNIWPMILTLLIQIFDKNQQKKKVNYNLQYAALKLIETISIVQMDEFYLHQWIFVFDYFGVIIEPINQLQVNSELDALQNNKQNQQNGKVISPFIFTPPISNSFPGTYSISYISQQYGEDIQQSIKKNKRSILLKDPLVSDENELKLKVMFFCQYMININQQRLEIEENEIESVIEDDFITLDDYIFQLSKQKN